jgi:hypothetical protein
MSNFIKIILKNRTFILACKSGVGLDLNIESTVDTAAENSA